MKFSDLKLKTTVQSNQITLSSGEKINVKSTIPVSDKIDLIQIALQKAEEDGIYNQIKLDIYFHLNLLYLYTDIEFSIEDREDEMRLYDILERNGVIVDVISAIGEEEYEGLVNYLEDMKKANLKYKNTAAAVLTRIVQDLPKNAAAAKEIVDSFDPEKYPEIINFVTAANGGRNINTNQPMADLQTVPVSTAAQENPQLKVVSASKQN